MIWIDGARRVILAPKDERAGAGLGNFVDIPLQTLAAYSFLSRSAIDRNATSLASYCTTLQAGQVRRCGASPRLTGPVVTLRTILMHFAPP